MDLQFRVSRKDVEIGIAVKNGRTRAYGYGRDQAVNELPWGLPLTAATPVERCRIVVVG